MDDISELLRTISRQRKVQASTARLIEKIAYLEENLEQLANEQCIAAQRYVEATSAILAIASVKSSERRTFLQQPTSAVALTLKLQQHLSSFDSQLTEFVAQLPNISRCTEQSIINNKDDYADEMHIESESDDFSEHELVREQPSFGFDAPKALQALTDDDLPAFLAEGLPLQRNLPHARAAKQAWLDLDPDAFAKPYFLSQE